MPWIQSVGPYTSTLHSLLPYSGPGVLPGLLPLWLPSGFRKWEVPAGPWRVRGELSGSFHVLTPFHSGPALVDCIPPPNDISCQVASPITHSSVPPSPLLPGTAVVMASLRVASGCRTLTSLECAVGFLLGPRLV